METINTPDGIVTIWDSERDVSELCRKYISDDMATYVGDLIRDCDAEATMAQLQFQSDYNVMERELEGWHNELFELKSQLEQITYEADKQPGLSKRKILNKLDEIIDHLQTIL